VWSRVVKEVDVTGDLTLEVYRCKCFQTWERGRRDSDAFLANCFLDIEAGRSYLASWLAGSVVRKGLSSSSCSVISQTQRRGSLAGGPVEGI
jgi:hypothetical protein